MNLYGFADGDPVNFSDPFGLCPVCPALYAAFEVGASIFDGVDLSITAIRHRQGKVSDAELAVTGAGAAVGLLGFGGGYGRGARAVVRAGGDASDWSKLSGMLRDASKGKGNFRIGSATGEQAEVLGKAWVGEGFSVASDGKTLISADGLRQYRPGAYKPSQGKVQANLEWRQRNEGASQAHIDISPR